MCFIYIKIGVKGAIAIGLHFLEQKLPIFCKLWATISFTAETKSGGGPGATFNLKIGETFSMWRNKKS